MVTPFCVIILRAEYRKVQGRCRTEVRETRCIVGSSMEDNKATLTGYQKSPDDGHSYPEVAALPDNSDPTYTGALYEHLPGEAGQPAVRHERRMSPTGAPQGKRLEGNNTVYGTHAVPPVSKKAYKDRTPLGGKLHPGGRRKRSGVVACGAAVLFVGLALLLSIAALVLFVSIYYGILTPLVRGTLCSTLICQACAVFR